MLKDFDAIIKNAQCILEKKFPEQYKWTDLYKLYAEQLIANVEFIKGKRKNFREWAPLYFYITTSSAKGNKSKLVLDVRYLGQNVAELVCDKNDKVTISTDDYNYNNERDFGCTIKLAKCDNVDWKDATEFRKYFRDREPAKKNNLEHKIESMLLTEFSKKGGDKFLRGIQPVKFAGKIRFPMPTALSASNHSKLELPKTGKGGGIDILTRVGASPHTRLCIIELKDENNCSEPPKLALQQAVEYTTFIRELLRSEGGSIWWELFGFSSAIPAQLTLYATCAMPTREPTMKDDDSFERMQLTIDSDIIECHYIYFSMSDNNNSLKLIKTSLPQIKNK